MAKKIQHWKHGWIPLTPQALAEARQRGVDVTPAQAKAAADADWLARERAKIAAAPVKAPARPASKVAAPWVDKPKAAAQDYSGWVDKPPATAPLKDHVEAFFSNFAYMKATDSLPITAEDYELDNFLSTIGDFARTSDAANAKKLLDHADRLGIRLPKEIEDGLKAYRR